MESIIRTDISEKFGHVSSNMRKSFTVIFIYQELVDTFLEDLLPENVPVSIFF